MTENAREDLALIFAVMAAAVLENMVAAVFVGLLLGLVLFAARNARRPVRNVWTGGQMASVCARSRADLQVLAQHGDDIRVFELEGDLFFGSTDALERVLGQHTLAQTVPVVDWSRVRHIDTSVALAIARYEKRVRAQGVAPIHAGLPPGEHELATLLRMHLPHALEAPDRDRALELAENEVLRRHGRDTSPEVTSMLDAAILFKGLDEAERTRLEAAMEQRTFKAGETIMKAGEPGDEMMLVLFGSASIIGHTPEGESVRIAGVRRGATLGELAFLDRAQRSATVVASEDTLVAVLGRAQFERLSQEEPHLVHRLLANIAASIAERLRHTNRLALARQNTR